MVEPITLTAKGIAEKALEYYKAGKLTAQHPNPSGRSCINFGDVGYRCAVAASYPDEWVDTVHFGTVEQGVNMGYIMASTSVLGFAVRLQCIHDMWAIAANSKSTEKGTEEAASYLEKEFLRLITNCALY